MLEPTSLKASGVVALAGGTKFQGTLADADVQAGNGISVALAGQAAFFGATKSSLEAGSGSATITSLGDKAVVELAFGAVYAGNGVTVSLAGNESDLKVAGSALDVGSRYVRLEAVGDKTKVYLSDSSIKVAPTGRNVTVQASMNGSNGSVTLRRHVSKPDSRPSRARCRRSGSSQAVGGTPPPSTTS